ncbi:MAG: acyl-CoA dehydrogenase family protein, partial [Planctomycetota bacterium]
MISFELTEEQQALREMTARFAREEIMPVAAHHDATGEYPVEIGRKAFELVRGLTPLLWENVECDLESDGEVAFIRCNTGGDPQASRFTTEYAVGLAV